MKLRALLVFAALAPLAVFADTYDSATLVLIRTGSPEQVQRLRDEGVDVVGRTADGFKALVTDEQLARLTAAGLPIEILYAEMSEDRARWAEVSRTAGLATSYYTASKFNTTNPPAGSLMEHLLQQNKAHPSITRLYNLGPSQDGAYDVIAMQISKNPDVVEAEPKIRIYGNIHGDEKGGLMVACDVLDTILSGYDGTPMDPTAKRLVDETEMWFIPMGNPYGNAHMTRYNSRSVDLNRNFWGPDGSDAPPAWSEKETQAIRDLTETATASHAKKRFAISISFHEGEIVFNSVWNYTTSRPSDEAIFWSSRTGGSGCVGQTINNCPTLAPNGLAQAYKDGCTKPGFWYTEGYDWYGTRGDTNDWAYGAWTQLDTTIELNSQKTPAASQIPTYCAQHRQAVLNYMRKVFQGIHGVMRDAVSSAPLDGTVTVTATASAAELVPHAYKAVYTDPVAGDYHRVLQPGTYTVKCEAPGYATLTIPGVTVTADTKSIVDCPMARTALAYDSSSVTDACATGGGASGDGVLDAGENATLAVTLRNSGTSAATNVGATLDTTAPGITITTGHAAFDNVPGGGTGASRAPHFAFEVAQDVACGTIVPFALHVTATEGAWNTALTVGVGQPVAGAAQTIFVESFDGTTFPPAGWAQADVNGTAGNWARSTATVHPSGGVPHSGAGLAYFNAFTANASHSTRLYRSTASSIPASAVAPALTFWMFHDAGDASDDTLQVQVSINGGTLWTNVGPALLRADGTTGWAQHRVALDSYAGQAVQVALLGVSSAGNDIHVDDVQLGYNLAGSCTMNPCLAPAAPNEVSTLDWAGRDTLTWSTTARATVYHLYRGGAPDLPALLDARTDSCLRYAGPLTSAPVPQFPAAGTLDWFLVTGLNGTLEGPAGDATAGPRVVNASGDCP